MDRREIFKHSLLALGAGVSGLAPVMALAEEKKTYAGQLEMLKGQEGVGNPREAHAYAMGMQAFEYGFPLIYFANIMYKWAKDPNSVMRPLNSWISPKDFVATSNYRDGGSFNTDTVYAGAFVDLRQGPIVLLTSANATGGQFLATFCWCRQAGKAMFQRTNSTVCFSANKNGFLRSFAFVLIKTMPLKWRGPKTNSTKRS